MADETTNGQFTRYLRLAYGDNARQNRNWDILDGRALDLARELFANIPAGGDLQGYYPDPTIRDGAVSDAQITDVAWSKVTGAPFLLPDAPTDGKLYGRKDALWSEIVATGSGDPALGGDLSGVCSNAVVLKSTSTFSVGSQLLALNNIDPLVWGSRTMKGRLVCSASSDFYGFTVNSKLTSQQDDPTKPSWFVVARSDALDQFQVGRSPAGGGPAIPLFTVGADGRSTVADFLFATGIELNTTIRLGPSGPAPSDGTLQYTGTKFQGRVAGAWVDIPGAGGSGGIPEAPNDGQTYGRKSLAWAVVPTGGGGPTGPDRTARTLAGGTTLLDATAEVHYASAISNATLPLAASCPGRIYEFAPANQINLGRSGSDTIIVGTAAGVTSLAITANMRVTLISDGISAWRVISADPALSITGIGASGALVGTYPGPTLASNAVSAINIGAGQVQPTKMAGTAPGGGDAGKIVVLDHTNPSTQWKITPATISAAGSALLPDTLNIATAAAGTTPLFTLKTASSAIRMRVGSLTAGNFQLYTNADFTNVQDDNAKPSLAWVFDAIAREFGFYGAPAGSPAVWSQMLALTATGTWIPNGDLKIGPSGVLKTRVTSAANGTGGGIFLNRDWINANTPDDLTKPSWAINLKTDTDNVLFQRAPAGSSSPLNLVTINSVGGLLTSGDIYVGTSGVFLSTSNPACRALMQAYPYGGSTILEFTANQGQIVAAKPIWTLRLDAAASVEGLSVMRAAPSGGATTTPLLLNSAGDLFITGAVGQKSTGTTWANPSDIRLKRDVAPYTTGLAAITQLQPITYKFNGKAGIPDDDRECWGFDASEVAAVMPECVGTQNVTLGEKDEFETAILTLDQSNIILALVNAVKELATRVQALEGAN